MRFSEFQISLKSLSYSLSILSQITCFKLIKALSFLAIQCVHIDNSSIFTKFLQFQIYFQFRDILKGSLIRCYFQRVSQHFIRYITLSRIFLYRPALVETASFLSQMELKNSFFNKGFIVRKYYYRISYILAPKEM